MLSLIPAFLLIIAIEVPGMVTKGQKGELRLFWALLALGVLLTLVVLQEWPVPNPTEVVTAVFRPITALLGFK